MTREDINNIISIICPNDEDFEKPCISPAYLKKELEALAIEQEPILDKIRTELHATAEMHEDGVYYLREKWIDEIIDKYKAESEETDANCY